MVESENRSVMVMMIWAVLFGTIFMTSYGEGEKGFPLEFLASPDSVRTTVFQVSGDGNVARYRVQEQLAGVNFPNDAVGETGAIIGQIVVGENGAIERDLSRLSINMSLLGSGSQRRDRYIRNNTLLTHHYPEMLLFPAEFRGLPGSLPVSGEHTFLLLADVVLKGVRHPSTWEVTATFEEGHVRGTASTVFTFEDLGLEKPRAGIVLSVADEIRLEYEFALDQVDRIE